MMQLRAYDLLLALQRTKRVVTAKGVSLQVMIVSKLSIYVVWSSLPIVFLIIDGNGHLL